MENDMHTTWKVTEADRDAAGSIKVDGVAPAEPRSLADLLPTPQSIKADAQRAARPMSKQEMAALSIVALMAAFVVVYIWRNAPAVPAPAPRTTAVATAPAVVATIAPTAPPAALVGYFDYRDPTSIAPITANQITRVVGTAGDGWRLVDVGNARVWIPADQVPAGVAVDEPLPDLAPRRPTERPAPAVRPVVAPVATPIPCTQDIAQYVIHRQVLDGTMPIGEVTGWSCASQAAAERAADEQEAQLRAKP
jgi:hypothetical protein